MSKAKKFSRVIGNKKFWTVIAVAFTIIVVAMMIFRFKDYSWSYYTEQFGLSENSKLADVIETLGEPLDISKEEHYTSLYYNGFHFRFDGGYSNNPFLRAIFIEDGSIRMLRNGVAVGCSLDKMKSTYHFAREMKDTGFHEGGYILCTNDHVVADGGGIWIYYKYDSNGIITEISVTDGL